ncbi:MAG: hypothetical protein JRK53_16365 [Deltaproteobacteria bacterium]|nr:hypothetical protein [Deltaproteobacteria bacterium]
MTERGDHQVIPADYIDRFGILRISPRPRLEHDPEFEQRRILLEVFVPVFLWEEAVAVCAPRARIDGRGGGRGAEAADAAARRGDHVLRWISPLHRIVCPAGGK